MQRLHDLISINNKAFIIWFVFFSLSAEQREISRWRQSTMKILAKNVSAVAYTHLLAVTPHTAWPYLHSWHDVRWVEFAVEKTLHQLADEARQIQFLNGRNHFSSVLGRQHLELETQTPTGYVRDETRWCETESALSTKRRKLQFNL